MFIVTNHVNTLWTILDTTDNVEEEISEDVLQDIVDNDTLVIGCTSMSLSVNIQAHVILRIPKNNKMYDFNGWELLSADDTRNPYLYQLVSWRDIEVIEDNNNINPAKLVDFIKVLRHLNADLKPHIKPDLVNRYTFRNFNEDGTMNLFDSVEMGVVENVDASLIQYCLIYEGAKIKDMEYSGDYQDYFKLYGRSFSLTSELLKLFNNNVKIGVSKKVATKFRGEVTEGRISSQTNFFVPFRELEDYFDGVEYASLTKYQDIPIYNIFYDTNSEDWSIIPKIDLIRSVEITSEGRVVCNDGEFTLKSAEFLQMHKVLNPSIITGSTDLLLRRIEANKQKKLFIDKDAFNDTNLTINEVIMNFQYTNPMYFRNMGINLDDGKADTHLNGLFNACINFDFDSYTYIKYMGEIIKVSHRKPMNDSVKNEGYNSIYLGIITNTGNMGINLVNTTYVAEERMSDIWHVDFAGKGRKVNGLYNTSFLDEIEYFENIQYHDNQILPICLRDIDAISQNGIRYLSLNVLCLVNYDNTEDGRKKVKRGKEWNTFGFSAISIPLLFLGIPLYDNGSDLVFQTLCSDIYIPKSLLPYLVATSYGSDIFDKGNYNHEKIRYLDKSQKQNIKSVMNRDDLCTPVVRV